MARRYRVLKARADRQRRRAAARLSSAAALPRAAPPHATLAERGLAPDDGAFAERGLGGLSMMAAEDLVIGVASNYLKRDVDIGEVLGKALGEVRVIRYFLGLCENAAYQQGVSVTLSAGSDDALGALRQNTFADVAGWIMAAA